ncbi:hypothetical protein CALVIDRAFT_382523 [Calocera viscosa TUFC12733]|uniref:Uncharacterized protein n=1 Tax=Calocera viscosa (strain TUFC12733) TaxID=1330018 RepID=A0A167Q6M5_CALVF|nr:hypothetical protein CALVIDRAFT_382523 [Calocera viscosa TUFC12733]
MREALLRIRRGSGRAGRERGVMACGHAGTSCVMYTAGCLLGYVYGTGTEAVPPVRFGPGSWTSYVCERSLPLDWLRVQKRVMSRTRASCAAPSSRSCPAGPGLHHGCADEARVDDAVAVSVCKCARRVLGRWQCARARRLVRDGRRGSARAALCGSR